MTTLIVLLVLIGVIAALILADLGRMNRGDR